MNNNYCDDCFYCERFNGGARYCAYIFRTGERRPCEPGEGCTVKVRMRVNRKLKHITADNTTDNWRD